MVKVSVIVPLYKGKKYILDMIQQIEACSNKMSCEVELIFVNDYPEDVLESYGSNLINVVVLNTDINRGIHGARVEGLKHASGEFVWFLDQDDRVNDDFLKEQISALMNSDADAVVCGAVREGKSVYDSAVSLVQAVDLNFMLENGNFIVSPGQVLIRKDRIPYAWRDHILKINGVDDWFLWLCMLNEGCEFEVDDKDLYEHIDDGGNASSNTYRMFQSENEMLDIIIENHLFDDSNIERLSYCISKMQRNQICLLDKFRRMFFVYDDWMRLNSEGKNITSYLQKTEVKKIGIYGLGYIGKQLAAEIANSNIELVYCVDKNASFISSQYEILPDIDTTKEVELYVVTVLDGAEDICDLIRSNTGVCAKSFTLLLEEVRG